MMKKTMSIPEFCKEVGISRSLGYKLARLGKIPVLRLGERRIMIPAVAVERMLGKALEEIV